MQNTKRTFLIVLFFCSILACVSSVVTATETAQQKRPSAWELLRKYQAKQAKPKRVSVSELLDKYAKTQDKLQSFIYKSDGQFYTRCIKV